MELTTDQANALHALERWYRAGETQTIRMGGYAGTGKTTVIAALTERLPGVRVHYCAYTRKAASVLTQRLQNAGVATTAVNPTRRGARESSLVTSVHGLIKFPREVSRCTRTARVLGDTGRDEPPLRNCGDARCEITDECEPHFDPIAWRSREHLDHVDLIVLDEASMISEPLWNDLRGYGKPIIAVGDHGQLPPIEGNFNLMDENRLHIRLETIMRQAKDSAIITVAELARTTGRIPRQVFDGRSESYVAKMAMNGLDGLPISLGDDLAVLCGRNATRIAWNRTIRGQLGRGELPEVGDRIICLRNSAKMYNGMTATVVDVREKTNAAPNTWAALVAAAAQDGDSLHLGIRTDDDPEEITGVKVAQVQFNREGTLSQNDISRLRLAGCQLWDYAYALTVHKAQGSTIRRVVVIEERMPGGIESHKRWLYTAVTRASDKLLIIG